MRICLHTVRDLAPDFVGGTERLLVDLAKELTILGHEPFVVASGIRDEFSIDGVPIIHRLPSGFREKYLREGQANSNFLAHAVMREGDVESKLRRLGRYVDQQLQSINCDALHLNSFATSIFAESTIDAIVMNHENDLEYDSKMGQGFTSSFASIAARRVGNLHHAEVLSTPSQHYAEFYSQILGLEVRQVKCGISLTSFERSRRRLAYRKRVNEPVNVLLPARFDPFQKGHDIALKACRELSLRGFDVQFTFTGMRSDYENRLQVFLDESNALGVSDMVRVRRLTDIRSGYDSCDVVVSPERYCSYGLSISEALSLGIPTVLSEIPTYLEIANGFGHAFFYDTENFRDLADKIVEATSCQPGVCNEGATDFRMQNDLRRTAVQLIEFYRGSNQNRNLS